MDKDLSKNLNFFREKNNIEEVIRILLIEKNNNPIKTASAFQARQPIYESSIKIDNDLFNNMFSDQNFNDI